MTLLSFKELLSEASKVKSTGTPYKVTVTKDKEVNIFEDRGYEAWFYNATGKKIEIEIHGGSEGATVYGLSEKGVVMKTLSDLEDWKKIVETFADDIGKYFKKYTRFQNINFSLYETDSQIITFYRKALEKVANSLGFEFSSKSSPNGILVQFRSGQDIPLLAPRSRKK